MSSKSNVLRVLEEKKGESISGEELAKALQISRSAVWKAINELKKDGYQITAVTNRGYCLDPSTDLLSVEGMEPYLHHPEWKSNLSVYQLLESTNITAKKMALDNAPHGTVVFAEEQTGGRGRMGRSFVSPKHSGIYMSLLLRPRLSAQDSLLVTTAASVAVCRAIEKVTGIQAEIKWVNDIYVNQRKICGILTEAVTDFESGGIESIILGIGVNFSTAKEEFPEELQKKVGALFEVVPERLDRNQLAAEIVNQVLELCDDLRNRSFLEEYRSRSLVLGKNVQVVRFSQEPYPAKAVDIDGDGGLVLEREDGNVEVLQSGEVSIRGLFDYE